MSDDEFEFEQIDTAPKGPLKKTLDKPFDEVHEVSDSGNDESSHDASMMMANQASPAAARGGAAAARGSSSGASNPNQRQQQQQQQQQQAQSFDDDDDLDHDASASASFSPPPRSSKDSKKDKKKDSRSKSRDSNSGGGQPMQGKPGNMPMQGKPGNMQASSSAGKQAELRAGVSSSDDESDDDQGGNGGAANQSTASAMDGSTLDDSTAAAGGGAPAPGLYNPGDYAHLVVTSEISDLFEYISRHKPADIELDTKLKPFIPDYIPAVGEIDAFLKVPQPDKDTKLPALGLVVLDEPAALQSDPTVLELSLRAVNKAVISKHVSVGSIEQADKHTKRVMNWVASIEDVHRKKPPPHVHYARPMPEIDQLMQVWPQEFEQMLHQQAAEQGGQGGVLPPMASIECDVAQFARMVLAIMDIPVHDKLTESLHVLFTLYAEFQNHAYFQH